MEDFSMAFKITNMVVFEVRYNHVGSNKEADFATSAVEFTRNKKTYSRAGQCQDDVLPKDSEAYKFYTKWDKKHLTKLEQEEYDDLMKDLEVLKSNYEYIYKEGNWDIPFSELVELSKPKKKVKENLLKEDNKVEKREQDLRDMILNWCDSDEDMRYSDVDEVTDQYMDTIMSSEDLANFGYTEADEDEIKEIVYEIVDTYIAEHNDIYAMAEEFNGDLSTDYLDDDEWKEIFENAPEVFKDALDKRAGFVKDWWGEIPDLVWDELMENVDEQLGFINYGPRSYNRQCNS